MPVDNRSLRIQFVTTSLMHGGAEVQVFLLAAELKRRGHEVSLVTMRDPEAFQPELRALGIPLVSLSMRRGVGDPRAIWRLAKAVRDHRPHVAHSHMVHANLLSRLTRPLAWTPVQVSTAHNLTEGARWRELAYRATDPLCDLTTNVCRKCVEHFIEVGATPRTKIRYMPNGLDLGKFRPSAGARAAKRAELGVPSDTFLWLAVGRVEEQKDYPNLIRAVKRLAAASAAAATGGAAPPAPAGSAASSGPFTVVVAGSGALSAEMEVMARETGLGAALRFLGDRTDVVDLMAAADGYVMSSAWEGLPMVLLEAGASHLPAVVTDVGGNREAVEDGVTGFVVPPHDDEALAAAMTNLMALGAADLEAMGRRSRAHVESSFALASVVDRWEALYRELLGRRGKTDAQGA